MQLLKISESNAARRRIPVKLVDSTDGKTEEAGLAGTATVTVSKNGVAYAPATGSFVEIGSGSYYYQAALTELDTPGFLLVRVVEANARTFDASVEVVAFDPHDAVALGLSRIDVALSTLSTAAALAAVAASATSVDGKLTVARAGYLDNLSAGAVAQASALVTAQTDLTTLTGRLTAPRAAAIDNLDATIASRASATSLTTAIAGIAAVEADTQDLQARTPAALVGGRVDAYVGAMATDAISAAAVSAAAATKIGATVTAPSASVIADAVCDEALAGHATAGTVGAALSTLLAGVAALPTAAAVVAAVMAEVVGGSGGGAYTFRQVLKRLHGFVAGNGTRQDGDGAYSFTDTDGSTVLIAGTRAGTTVTVTARGG